MSDLPDDVKAQLAKRVESRLMGFHVISLLKMMLLKSDDKKEATDKPKLLVAVHAPNLLYSRFVLLSMSQQLPIPEPLWDTYPPMPRRPSWRPGRRGRIGSPSWKPPSATSRPGSNSTPPTRPSRLPPTPSAKRKPPAPPSRRKRGGQPGHRKAFRALVPPEKLRSSTDCKPPPAGGVATPCAATTPPLIHQVAELPRIEPIVDEYRLHRLACPGCGTTTCGTLPEGVPTAASAPTCRPSWPPWPAPTA